MKPLQNGKKHIHTACKENFWPMNHDFILPFTIGEIDKLAKKNVMARVTVPGVQPKISLAISGAENKERITIVGALEGDYILKPPHNDFSEMPEIEALSMHLANACGVETVPFSLIPFQSGELAYITKRIDRNDKQKIAMEDFCQLTGRLTEHKYRGSYEQVAKAIAKYAANNLLEVVCFYEIVLVSYLMGNADMHLKNFSLIKDKAGYKLSSAYDMVATKLFLPQDQEELALTLNGKKSKLTRNDFERAMKTANLPQKAIHNLFNRVLEGSEKWIELIGNSLLSKTKKNKLMHLVAINKKNVV